MISYVDLLVEHREDVRVVPIAALRATYQDVHWRRWQGWKSIAGCPPRSRKISRLSALKLQLLATASYRVSAGDLPKLVDAALRKSPRSVERWLEAMAWEVKGDEAMFSAFEGFRVDVRWRQRFYDWFQKSGQRYSARATYDHAQIARAVAVARRGVGRGRPRRVA